MKLKKNMIKSILIVILFLIFTVSVYEYSRFKSSEETAEKITSQAVPADKIHADTKKAAAVNSTETDSSIDTSSAAERTDEPAALKKDLLIEGVVVSKDIAPGGRSSDSTDYYYLYLRDTSGRLRKFETTKLNFDSVKTGDHIFYKYTSGKNYQLVVLPDKN